MLLAFIASCVACYQAMSGLQSCVRLGSAVLQRRWDLVVT